MHGNWAFAEEAPFDAGFWVSAHRAKAFAEETPCITEHQILEAAQGIKVFAEEAQADFPRAKAFAGDAILSDEFKVKVQKVKAFAEEASTHDTHHTWECGQNTSFR